MIECEFCTGVNYESEEAIEIHYKNYHATEIPPHLKFKAKVKVVVHSHDFIEKEDYLTQYAKKELSNTDFATEATEEEIKLVEKSIREDVKMFGMNKKDEEIQIGPSFSPAKRKVKIIAYCDTYEQAEELMTKVNKLSVDSKNKISIALMLQQDLGMINDDKGEDYGNKY